MPTQDFNLGPTDRIFGSENCLAHMTHLVRSCGFKPQLVPTNLLQIACVNPAGAGVVTAQDASNLNRRAQLRGKARSCSLASGTSVIVLAEANVLGVGLAGLPLRPTLGVYDVRHGGVLDGDTGILLPRAAKIVSAAWHGVASLGGDSAVVEDVVRRVRGGITTGSRYIAKRCCQHPDVALREPGRSALTEDEVCAADDERACIELGARLSKDCVLVARELAGVVALILELVSILPFHNDVGGDVLQHTRRLPAPDCRRLWC